MFRLIILSLFAFICDSAYCQDTALLSDKASRLSDKAFTEFERTSNETLNRLDRSTIKYLGKLRRSELKMFRSAKRKDSIAAKEIFGDVDGRYDSLKNVLTDSANSLQTSYDGHVDSLTTSIRFLQKKDLPQSVKQNMQSALGKYANIQDRLNKTDFVQKQIAEREELLKSRIQSLGLNKELERYKAQAYYYRAQMDEYRHMLDDPKKLESTLLKIANRFPSFQKFFARYSQLGQLFRLPGLEEENAMGITGLQTRAMIMQDMQQQLGSVTDVQRYISSNVSDAQSELQTLRDRVNQSGASSDVNMPDFRPNNQRTKSFLKRIEVGTNIQSVKSNFFFPTTTDLGFSLGYRFNSKITAGVGASYKVGWGKDIRHISITHQGIGLRTFSDIKLKGSIWISGGGEMNYRSAFRTFSQLKNSSGWQKSALIGLSKKYQINNKMKGNLQVLYDFLYKKKLPEGQPLIFRMGYNLK